MGVTDFVSEIKSVENHPDFEILAHDRNYLRNKDAHKQIMFVYRLCEKPWENMFVNYFKKNLIF